MIEFPNLLPIRSEGYKDICGDIYRELQRYLRGYIHKIYGELVRITYRFAGIYIENCKDICRDIYRELQRYMQGYI